MKSLCVLLVFVFGAVVAVEKFTTKYDGVNIAEVFGNKRLFNGYFECVMGRRTCTKDGQELKDALPKALATDCAGCSKAQKEKTKEALALMIEKYPEHYKEAEAKFDPQRVYRKKNKDLIEKFGLKIDV